MLELTGLYETGEARFAPTENSVKSFLEDSRQLNLCRLKEKNICLELQCEPADLKKNFDKDLMLSLVNNFIDNAVKASAAQFQTHTGSNGWETDGPGFWQRNPG